MNTVWLSIAVVFVVFAALLPDDAAILLDLIEVWLATAWVWIRTKLMMARLWVRLKWDGSYMSWRLWRIRQRMRYNSTEPTNEETNE